jgi:serine/threonine-protein kinase
MPTPAAGPVLDALGQPELLRPEQLAEVRRSLQAAFPEPAHLIQELVQRGWLTSYQAEEILAGRGAGLSLGRYLLLERLGQGGMGEVFKARHTRLDRTVALKVIRKERLQDPGAVERFQREARAAARLSHPNVVPVHDADQAGETHFLVMEYVEGMSLARLVKHSGPLAVARACEYIRQAALGLQHLCDCGLVHRDVKPGNLLLTARDQTIKVLDLGLALLHGPVESDPSEPLTDSGVPMGTPAYMAPEQRLDAHRVDTRVDVYGLGCTLYYLLTGQPPGPPGAATATLEAVRPDVPQELVAVVRKMLASRPEDRYQTPAEVAAALVPFSEIGRADEAGPPAQGGMPSTVAGVGPSRPSRSALTHQRGPAATTWTYTWGRPRWHIVAAAVLLAAIAAGIAWWLWSAEEDEPVERPAARLVVGDPGAHEGSVFATVREALAVARPGDHVVVVKEVLEEQLVLADGALGKGVTLEAAAPSGRPVVWRPPHALADSSRLIELAGAGGLVLKGFVLDGGRRVQDLVVLSGPCPGLRLEDLHLRGFGRSAVCLRSCAGTGAQPVRLLRLRTTTEAEAPAALVFESRPDRLPPLNEHVEVRDGRFEGPYQACVEVAGPVAGVRFQRNRFFRAADGLRYKSAAIDPRHRIDLSLDANTFCEVRGSALHLEALPLAAAGSRLLVRSNLFARTGVLAQANPPPGTPPPAGAKWIWLAKESPSTRAGCFRTVFYDRRVVVAARLEVLCDRAFTVWLNSVPLVQGVAGRQLHTFDVTQRLNEIREGPQVLAIRCEGGKGPPGLLAQLERRFAAGAPALQRSGPDWKGLAVPPAGWQDPGFNASGWPRVASCKVALLGVTAAGNACDRTGREGTLPLRATALDFTLPTDPADDAHFLRYPASSLLSQAGPGRTPVGVPAGND